MVNIIISTLGATIRKESAEENWLLSLGQAIAAVSSYESTGLNVTCPYVHVFCMSFEDPFALPHEELKKCTTVDEILTLTKHKNLTEKFNSMGYKKLETPSDYNNNYTDEASIVEDKSHAKK